HPELEREPLLYAQQNHCPLRFAEEQVLGFDHAFLGGILLKKWRLPSGLEDAIAYHHQPLLAEHPLEASMVHIADIVTNGLGMGTSGEHFVPLLLPGVWEGLGLEKEFLTHMVPQLDFQLKEIEVNFFGGVE
ncbi:MAG: HDOD domain-containing protein, partial [Deltaproteobacteria bacterium]|nr:HDOD domain-containing protein [Deltaproteobacteria bacterium]